MSNQFGIHCYVTGKVQGVWFRASTKTQAELLGLTGWVRNLPDGRVEVMAYGDQSQLDELKAWLKQGPPKAEVTDLMCEASEWVVCQDFNILS